MFRPPVLHGNAGNKQQQDDCCYGGDDKDMDDVSLPSFLGREYIALSAVLIRSLQVGCDDVFNLWPPFLSDVISPMLGRESPIALNDDGRVIDYGQGSGVAVFQIDILTIARTYQCHLVLHAMPYDESRLSLDHHT